MAETIPTFPITHPDHGDAVCDDRMWAEFSAAGWAKKDAAADAGDGTDDGKKGKKKKGE